MANMKTTSTSIVASSRGTPNKGWGETKYSRTKSITTTSVERNDPIKGALNIFANAEMILITMLTLSFSVVAFSDIGTPQYLQSFMPNYNTNNQYNEIPNPTELNYVQYGDQVLDTLVSFVQTIGSVGEWAKAGWDAIIDFVGPTTIYGSFSTTFTQARQDELQLMKSFILSQPATMAINGNDRVYVNLTTAEQSWVLANVSSGTLTEAEKNLFYKTEFYIVKSDTYGIYGGLKLFFTEPSVYTLINEGY